METTTINKSLTEALSSTGFVKIEASRKESEPFQHIDAYIYDAVPVSGTRPLIVTKGSLSSKNPRTALPERNG